MFAMSNLAHSRVKNSSSLSIGMCSNKLTQILNVCVFSKVSLRLVAFGIFIFLDFSNVSLRLVTILDLVRESPPPAARASILDLRRVDAA